MQQIDDASRKIGDIIGLIAEIAAASDAPRYETEPVARRRVAHLDSPLKRSGLRSIPAKRAA